MSMERALRGFAGFFILVSLVLAHFVNRNWLWFTAFVGFNLFQSAFSNWCPMMWVLKKCGVNNYKESKHRTISIIISSNDAETCWNAVRFANFSLNNKDEVSVFLIGKGVEYESVSNEQFNIIEQAEKFLASGGKIFACGTCLKQRNSSGSNLCPVSTMKDMYRIVSEADKILSF